MRRLRNGLIVVVVWLVRRHPPPRTAPPPSPPERMVPAAPPAPRAELAVIVLLLLAALSAAAFVGVYALDGIAHQTQLLGLTIGGAFALTAAALIVTAHRLVVTEELEQEYGEPDPQAEERIVQLFEESGSGLRRRRLLALAAAAAASALGLAILAPLASLGPMLDLAGFRRTPWRRGRRLVDAEGHPIAASAIRPLELTTAFPQGADPELIGSPVVLIRLDPATLRLPASRRAWSPDGILAFSKICTHAGCAVALYRAPLFEPVEQPPGLVCPCHYSTFDPATGGTVVFGPAGRPLPQLPLMIDGNGDVRAGGGLSGPPGPSWWGVRKAGS
jgi:ubiquinol-cytochrome c reductase iron-sulfur subunit